MDVHYARRDLRAATVEPTRVPDTCFAATSDVRT
jgi:hypothetical protein